MRRALSGASVVVLAVVVLGWPAAGLWARPERGRKVAVATPGSAFQADVVTRANENTDYRRVIYTGQKTQLVVMSLPAGGEVGEEMHHRVEQVFFCVAGRGQAVVNGRVTPVSIGTILVMPPGTRHNVKNAGKVPLKLYTIYSPPNHLDGRVQATRADAEADRADAEFGRRVEQGKP